MTEAEVEEDRLHFYRIPVPPSLLSGKGRRGITVALAYDPPVRSSREEYLARTMFVDVVQGLTTPEVARYKTRFQGAGQPPSPPNGAALSFRPPATIPQWSTLQVRRIAWARAPRLRMDTASEQNLHVIVGCQRRFATGLETRQRYGLVVHFCLPRMSRFTRSCAKDPPACNPEAGVPTTHRSDNVNPLRLPSNTPGSHRYGGRSVRFCSLEGRTETESAVSEALLPGAPGDDVALHCARIHVACLDQELKMRDGTVRAPDLV